MQSAGRPAAALTTILSIFFRPAEKWIWNRLGAITSSRTFFQQLKYHKKCHGSPSSSQNSPSSACHLIFCLSFFSAPNGGVVRAYFPQSRVFLHRGLTFSYENAPGPTRCWRFWGVIFFIQNNFEDAHVSSRVLRVRRRAAALFLLSRTFQTRSRASHRP